jgi:hypothetical protein
MEHRSRIATGRLVLALAIGGWAPEWLLAGPAADERKGKIRRFKIHCRPLTSD